MKQKKQPKRTRIVFKEEWNFWTRKFQSEEKFEIVLKRPGQENVNSVVFNYRFFGKVFFSPSTFFIQIWS